MIGKTLSHYEVLDKIGAGGMGEVFRARDTKLGREVALKVLPQVFAENPERLARFKREAKLLASLNHANIATLHGLEEVDGLQFLVMELVDGEDLSEVLRRGPLRVNEAVRIARAVAEALVTAHEQGVVHRDLKPGNIKLTSGGQVKVLDFGLAKVFEPDPSSADLSKSPTITAMGTVQGVILGTAAYMSPEQARGKEVDKRTDVWAFGAVLYEMLAGRQSFPGDTVSDTIAKILERDPDWSHLPPDTPPAVVRLLTRCLEKDKDRRLRDIGDARVELEDALTGMSSVSTAMPATAGAAPVRAKRPIGWMVATAVAVLAAVIASVAYFRSEPAGRALTRSTILPNPGTTIVATGDFSGPAVISPDGKAIAYVAVDSTARRMLWLRALESIEARVLTGTEDAIFPFWSADSRSIGFFAKGKLKRIETQGGLPITLCDAGNGRGGTWSKDGTILFTSDYRRPIVRVSASGGTPVAVTTVDSTRHTTHRWPSFLPDGDHFLYIAANHDMSKAEFNTVYMGSLHDGQSREIMRLNSRALYSAGQLLFVRDANLIAAPFDPDKGVLTDSPTPLVDKVEVDPTTWMANFSVSDNGILIYHPGDIHRTTRSRLTWFDRAGTELGVIGSGDMDAFYTFQLSPDNQRLAASAGATSIDVWIFDLGRDVRTRATFTADTDVRPVWSPDGKQIVYAKLPLGEDDGTCELLRIPAGGGDPTLILERDEDIWPADWSADGLNIACVAGDFGTRENDIWIVPVDAPDRAYPLLATEFSEWTPAFSPNGRWIAYASNESGPGEVYVMRFRPNAPEAPPDAGTNTAKWQVSVGGGLFPRWNQSGRELFYITVDGKLMSAEINGDGDQFVVGRVTQLFSVNFWNLGTIGYDVAANGERFIINAFTESRDTPVTLVLNWTQQLRR